jgi:hypothetical protein
MDFDGFRLIFMDFNDFDGFHLISMVPEQAPELHRRLHLMDSDGFRWISMDFVGFRWISMDFDGFP